jgi:hypothetical protein
MASGSAAASHLAKPWAVKAGQRALEDAMRRNGVDGLVQPAGAAGHFRTRYAVRGTPLVSVIVALTDGVVGDDRKDTVSAALERMAARTAYRHVEWIRTAVLTSGIQKAQGAHLLFLADGPLEPLAVDWIDALMEWSQQDSVGAVGGWLLRSDDTVQHAGFVLGGDGGPANGLEGEPSWTRGHLSTALDVRNCTAVSAACLLTRRSVFDEVGGLDQQLGELIDVDYGLRLWRANLRVVITPHARLRYPGPVKVPRSNVPPSRARLEALARLRETWGARLDRDPFYNVNFDRRAASFRLPPVTERPSLDRRSTEETTTS